MSNGYPPSASPLGGSPSPGPSPALGGGSGNKGSNPSRHSPQPPPPPPPPHPHRTNLRVVIPTPLTQPLSEDTSYDVSALLSSYKLLEQRGNLLFSIYANCLVLKDKINAVEDTFF